LANKRKFRGTHLLDDEQCFDDENDKDELDKEFAWSFLLINEPLCMTKNMKVKTALIKA